MFIVSVYQSTRWFRLTNSLMENRKLYITTVRVPYSYNSIVKQKKTRVNFWSLLTFTGISKVYHTLLKLINNSSRENKENHYCDRGLDMCS